MTATQSAIVNPFRVGTHIYRLFDALADGSRSYLGDLTAITYESYGRYAGLSLTKDERRRLRKRTASLIRTIRAYLRERKIGDVVYTGTEYRMQIN